MLVPYCPFVAPPKVQMAMAKFLRNLTKWRRRGGGGKEEKEVVVTYDEQAFNPERTNSHGR